MIDHGQVRRSDPATSHEAARLVRPGSARHALLMAHNEHRDGLTDEEAALIAHLSLTSEYATRCSELARVGLLVDTPMARAGSSGMARLVRRITLFGIATLEPDVPEGAASRTPAAPSKAPVFGDLESIRAYRR